MDNSKVKSDTNFWVNCLACFMFFFIFFIGRTYFEANNTLFIFLCFANAIMPIAIYEIYSAIKSGKPHIINFTIRNKFNLERIVFKLIGLGITFGFVYLVYNLLPVYRDKYYFQFYAKLLDFINYIFVLAVPYFIVTDLMMKHPKDVYYFIGRLAIFDFKNFDNKLLGEHIKAWLVKIFFLPLMCIYGLSNFNFLHNFNPDSIVTFKNVYDFLYSFIFTIDIVFAILGYAMTLKLFNTQIYSAEPTMFGWVICLLCYEPFWPGVFQNNYFAYEDNYFWGDYFSSELMYTVWGSLILFCLAIYSFATVAFGMRFSNITYRGLVTNGPYAFTKHPAYVFKNLSWWLISIPCISPNLPWEVILRNCLMLFGINLVYYLRARTEENHLSNYPEYVAYAEMMNEKSIFAWVGKIFPFMRYSLERTKNSGSKVYPAFVQRDDVS